MNAVNPLQPSPPPGADSRPHEPSMEEILASIRRIIADDQVSPGSTAGSPAHDRPAGPTGAGPLRGALRERMAFRGEDREASSDTGDRPRPAVAADREAMVRSPEAEAIGSGLSAYGQVTAPQFPTPEGLSPERSGPDRIAAEAIRPFPFDARVDASIDMPAATDLPETAPRTARDETWQGGGEAARPVSRDPGAQLGAQAGERTAALFSTTTNQSVSSAFNMLAATRLADNSDELLAIAREMIRPLLKTWLDDNLPSLVERLVRAEIERVARGGR